MPAQNYSKSSTVYWYETNETTNVTVKRSAKVVSQYRNQVGRFPLKKPKPLPYSTPYSSSDMRQPPSSKFDQRLIIKKGNPGNNRSYSGYPTALLSPYSLPVHDLDRYNEALASLRSTVLDGKWESGVFLGELRETMFIFHASAKPIIDLIASLRFTKPRRKRRNGRKLPSKGHWVGTWKGKQQVADSIAGIWLIIRYAITPLVYDVQTALEVLRKKMNVYDMRCSCVSPKKKSSSLTITKLDPGTVEKNKTTRIWFKAWFEPPGSYTALAKRFTDQLGLRNPALVAWELLTLSFVVDWFIDVGGYLEALGKPSGFKIHLVETNMLTIESQVIDPSGTKVYSNGDVLFQLGEKCQRDMLQYNRTNGGWPAPIAPNFDPTITVKRFFDSLALLKVLSPKIR